MAETLTYDPTPADPEILTSDEQDSLKVGEELQSQQEQLLAGKYENAQELEKAYIELEKKLGGSNEETTQETTQEVDKTEATEEDSSEKATLLDNLWEEASSGEKISDETLNALRSANPADIAQMHLEYRQQNSPRDLTPEDVTQLKGIAGGDEGYNSMMQWANENLNEQEVAMFDTVMEMGNPLAAFFAVRSLAYRYNDATGYEGNMVTGTAPKTSGEKFRSQAEVVAAMGDPRYDNDPAYRQDVMKKLERSDINF